MNWSRYKKLVIFIFSVFFISCLFLAWHINRTLNTPMLAKDDAPVIITLDKSATASQLVNTLKNKQLIHSTKLLLLMMRFEHLSNRLKAGVYQIHPGETSMQFLHRIIAGDVVTFNFTIIEGTTQKKITQDLMRAPHLTFQPDSWGVVTKQHANPEGLLLADTYKYPGGSDAKSLLEQAHHNLVNYLNDAWEHRAADLPYKTAYELLIAASIIERETAIPNERKLISGVILNRLKKNMPLQMDPTIIYALGDKYKGTLSHDDLSVNSPYNSYRNRGLPPTPIAMVGKEAIDAAAHPQLSNYLYFVAKGDGSHQFSQTYEEQKQAINQYRRNRGY